MISFINFAQKTMPMKNKTFLFAAISLLLLLGAAGCEKNEPFLPPTEAQQAIWGKWELISYGGILALHDPTEIYQRKK